MVQILVMIFSCPREQELFSWETDDCDRSGEMHSVQEMGIHLKTYDMNLGRSRYNGYKNWVPSIYIMKLVTTYSIGF